MKTINVIPDEKYLIRFQMMMFAIEHGYPVMTECGKMYEFTGIGFHEGEFIILERNKNYLKHFDIGCYRTDSPTITTHQLLCDDFQVLDHHQEVTEEEKQSYEHRVKMEAYIKSRMETYTKKNNGILI